MMLYHSTYYTKFFATRRYFVTLVTLLLAGCCVLHFAVPALASIYSYWSINDTITQTELYAEEKGWTNELKAEVKELEAERAELAKSNKIFDFCLKASKSNFTARLRNWLIVSVASFFLLGLLMVGFPVYAFVRDIFNKSKNDIHRRMETQFCEIELDLHREIEFIYDELFSMWGNKEFFDFDKN